MCGPGVTPPDAPLIGDGSCCYGAVQDGAGGCTCWVPEFDADQVPLDEQHVQLLAAGVEPTVRPGGMCGDCAYRPDSPERTGADGYKGDADTLETYAAVGHRFWCHDGLLRVVQWRHEPSGTTIDAHPATYTPPIDKRGVPYKADGSAGYLCAGWDARRRANDALAARLVKQAADLLAPWGVSLTDERAEQVRRWRISEVDDATWRGVAGLAAAAWPDVSPDYDGNQLFGRDLCSAAATLLGEDPDAEPWN